MEKNSILTSIQKRFLEAVIEEPYILNNYYFSGGTALSEFYLRHRISKDIDLFSEKEVHLPSIDKFIKKVAKILSATEIRMERYLGLYTFFFKIKKDLIKFAKIKFDWHIDPLHLAQSFFEVLSFADYPKMLVSFNKKGYYKKGISGNKNRGRKRGQEIKRKSKIEIDSHFRRP